MQVMPSDGAICCARGSGFFELRRRATIQIRREDTGPFGSSGASLHAKTFAVDGARVFVGSFNFDPRSTTLNTEMGLLIDSPALAGQTHAAFDRHLEGVAWQVGLQDDTLVWTSGDQVTTTEPGSSFLKSIGLTVIGWLPIEWLL